MQSFGVGNRNRNSLFGSYIGQFIIRVSPESQLAELLANLPSAGAVIRIACGLLQVCSSKINAVGVTLRSNCPVCAFWVDMIVTV